MSAVECFVAEVAKRELAIPADLDAELRSMLRAPYVNRHVLDERLTRGAAVIDRYGDDAAPAHIWLRWEALLIAWQCAELEVSERAQQARKRRPRKGRMERS